jgi:hypothetical protein
MHHTITDLLICCYTVSDTVTNTITNTLTMRICMPYVTQVKLDALPPSASYHRGASTDDEETTQLDGKKPVSAH